MKRLAAMAAAVFLFTACAGAVNSNPLANPLSLQRSQTPIQTRADVLAGVHHLYAGFGGDNQCAVAVYDLPLTKTSKPSATLFCFNTLFGLAIDDKYLYVLSSTVGGGPGSEAIRSYALPVSKFEPASATINLPSGFFPDAISVNNEDLYTVDVSSGQTLVFAVPLTNGESPTSDISSTIPGFTTTSHAGTQFFYVNPGGISPTGNLDAFALPLTNGEKPAVQLQQETASTAQYATTLYVASGHSAADAVYVYSLPLTPASKPKVISTPAFNPLELAVDEHNLFVATKGNSPVGFVKLRVYTLPLVSNESGLITLSDVNGDGMVVGP